MADTMTDTTNHDLKVALYSLRKRIQAPTVETRQLISDHLQELEFSAEWGELNTPQTRGYLKGYIAALKMAGCISLDDFYDWEHVFGHCLD